jgi:hypothetical protein
MVYVFGTSMAVPHDSINILGEYGWLFVKEDFIPFAKKVNK